MADVRIFLASSLEELKQDRLEIGNFIRKLNDIYRRREVYFRLYMCEDENIAMTDARKQQEYNQQLIDSQLCFVLFFNHAGERTIEECKIAYESFLECGTPSVVVFFRRGDGYAPDHSVTEVQEYLDHELGYYYKTYEHIDTLKLKLLMQVKLLDLDVPMELRNGGVLIDGVEALTLENIAAYAKNEEIQQMREQYEIYEQEFQTAKAHFLTHQGNEEEFLKASERRQQAKQAYEALEDAIFSLLLREEAAKQPLTPRQREAYSLVEQGRFKEASAMLDLEDILSDIAREEEMAGQMKDKLSQRVSELLQKANIEKAIIGDLDRFDTIIRIYEEATQLEEKYGLEKKAMCEYCAYLLEQREYGLAGQLAERYKKYMVLEERQFEIADACNMLGLIYSDNAEELNKAVSEYEQARKNIEQLAADDPEKYLPDVAATYLNIAEVLKKKGNFNEAIENCLRAKTIYEQVDELNNGRCLLDLATVCNDLGILYSDTYQYEKAEDAYMEAWRILDDLAEKGISINPSDIAMLYLNFGQLYSTQKRWDKAGKLLSDAKTLYEILVNENPQVNLPDLARTCNALGNFYSDTNMEFDAEAEYRLAINIRVELAKKNPAVYMPEIATTCHNLGILHKKMNRLDEAEKELNFSKAIREDLVDINREFYIEDLAVSCRQMGELYKIQGRRAEAETELLKAKTIFAELSRSNPKVYLRYLIDTCNYLGSMYQMWGEFNKAEQEFREAEDAGKNSNQIT